MPKNKCRCASEFEIRLARSTDYQAFKQILNKGHHPAFIGRQTMMRNADNGGAIFYCFQGSPIAVSLINPHYGILLALNVLPNHRGHGLGENIMRFLMPNFARVLESKVEWFERRGYRKIGQPKHGISLNTQIMVRLALFDLAGKLNRVWLRSKNESVNCPTD